MSDDGWRARIRACCQELAGLAVPPSLVHGDLHLANVAEAELQARLRAAYLPVWSSFEASERLALAWELAVPLGALHQAISYRSLMASLQPPIDLHMSQSTAWWLRQVLASLP